MLTNNKDRTADQEDEANPRADNVFGHIVEMTPPDGDHAAEHFAWDVLVRCGDPAVAEVGALVESRDLGQWLVRLPRQRGGRCRGPAVGRHRQGDPWPTGRADGLYALETEGARRRTAKLFFRCPVGAEMCGPCFTPDQQTLFVAVQHPGADATDRYKGFERASTFADPATRWPDFDANMPPRPSVRGDSKDRRRQDRLTRLGLASLLKKPRTRAS